jgi:hypothetical protein
MKEIIIGLLMVILISVTSMAQGFKWDIDSTEYKVTHKVFEDINKDGIKETVLLAYVSATRPTVLVRVFITDPDRRVYWIGVDLDNNARIDFSMIDQDGDGYFDTGSIKVFENFQRVYRQIGNIKRGIFILLERV